MSKNDVIRRAQYTIIYINTYIYNLMLLKSFQEKILVPA